MPPGPEQKAAPPPLVILCTSLRAAAAPFFDLATLSALGHAAPILRRWVVRLPASVWCAVCPDRLCESLLTAPLPVAKLAWRHFRRQVVDDRFCVCTPHCGALLCAARVPSWGRVSSAVARAPRFLALSFSNYQLPYRHVVPLVLVAGAAGDIARVDWLRRRLQWPADRTANSDWAMLACVACAFGHLSLAQWAVAMGGLAGGYWVEAALEVAIQCDHTRVVHWLDTEFRLPPGTAKSVVGVHRFDPPRNRTARWFLARVGRRSGGRGWPLVVRN